MHLYTIKVNEKIQVIEGIIMKKKLKGKDIINFFKYNQQFCAFVILSLMCTTIVRGYTLGNLSALQPLFIDLGFILLIGAFGFIFRPQKQFYYFFTVLIIFTIMGISNAIYYTFFSSFASLSLLMAIGQVSDVGDAFVSGSKLWHFIYLIFPIIFS